MLVSVLPFAGCVALFGLDGHAPPAGDAGGDGSSSGDGLASGDAGPADGAAGDGPVTGSGACDPMKHFGDITYMTSLNDTKVDNVSARLTADELTAFVTRQSLDASAPSTLWISKRSQVDASFPPPQLLEGDLNGPLGAQQATLTRDGARMVFATGPLTGTADLYVAERDDGGGYAVLRELSEIDTAANEYAPFLAADDRSLYYYVVGPGVGDSGAGIFEATLDDAGVAGPRALVTIDDPSIPDAGRARNPVVVNAGRTLYFARTESDGTAGILVATRADTSSPFTVARHVDELNTPMRDQGAWVSEDGCRIIFIEGDNTPPYERAIYMATKSP